MLTDEPLSIWKRMVELPIFKFAWNERCFFLLLGRCWTSLIVKAFSSLLASRAFAVFPGESLRGESKKYDQPTFYAFCTFESSERRSLPLELHTLAKLLYLEQLLHFWPAAGHMPSSLAIVVWP